MKISFPIIALVALPLIATVSSCGPSKKLVATREHVSQLQVDSINKHKSLTDCNLMVKNLSEEKAFVIQDLKDLSATSNMTISDQAKRLKALQTIVQSQKDAMNSVKNQVANALMNYNTDELEVYIKDGNVYVSMQEKLLFKSGSAEVDPKGKEALKALAEVLNKTLNVSVLIEGHTDNVPIKTKLFKDNWDLSTARATSIVRILTLDNGFDANRITAAGRANFHPVKPNDTEVGRSSNRRTEVILSPDLKEMFDVLGQ